MLPVAEAATQTITHHSAASAAAAIHMHYEGEVVETPLSAFAGAPALEGIAVLASAQGLVEFFPGESQPLDVLGALADVSSNRGWRVGVVVPAHRIGEAHGSLRGRPLHLQAWWSEGDRVHFGGPEVP